MSMTARTKITVVYGNRLSELIMQIFHFNFIQFVAWFALCFATFYFAVVFVFVFITCFVSLTPCAADSIARSLDAPMR